MTLVKTSVLNGFATAARISAALVLNKVLAVYVGPAGYTLVGQLQNAVAIASSVSGGAMAVGITKFTAQYSEDAPRQRLVWRTAAAYSLIATAVISLSLIFFRAPLARLLFDDSTLSIVFICLAFTLPGAAASSLLLAVLNGKNSIQLNAIQAVCVSILSCASVVGLAIFFRTTGALFALALNLTLTAIVTLGLCWKARWLTLDSFIGRPSATVGRPLLGYALMALTSALVAAGSQLLVRNHLIVHFGLIATGNWQAVFKISEIYLTMFTATLGLYYLPRLAQINRGQQLRAEIRHLYTYLLPAAALAAAAIYVLRAPLVAWLFTEQFKGMVPLFGLQLLGDVLKVGSWVLGFVMVGRGMVQWYVVTELIFSALWVLLVWVFTEHLGLIGATAAFACNYALYWLFMGWLIGRETRRLSD